MTSPVASVGSGIATSRATSPGPAVAAAAAGSGAYSAPATTSDWSTTPGSDAGAAWRAACPGIHGVCGNSTVALPFVVAGEGSGSRAASYGVGVSIGIGASATSHERAGVTKGSPSSLAGAGLVGCVDQAALRMASTPLAGGSLCVSVRVPGDGFWRAASRPSWYRGCSTGQPSVTVQLPLRHDEALAHPA